MMTRRVRFASAGISRWYLTLFQVKTINSLPQSITKHLSQPLKTKQVQVSHLAAVQRQRQLPTRFIQAFQSLIQQNIIKSALNNQTFRLPALLKLPILRDVPARIIGFGLFPPHVRWQE